LQGRQRCPSSLLVFWGGPAFPAQGGDPGSGTPRKGPAEKMLGFGLHPLTWQLLCVSTEVTAGGEELCGSLEGGCHLDPSAVVYYEIITQLRMTRMPGEASAASSPLQMTPAAPL